MSQKGSLIRLVIVKAPKMDPEFEKTYRDHYPKLFRIAAKMLQDPEGAKEKKLKMADFVHSFLPSC